jgi:hypothetical protein
MLVKKLEKKLNCILIASREAHKNGKKVFLLRKYIRD